MLSIATKSPSDPATGKFDKLEARAIGRILDRDSREVVGWVYEWNTGQREPFWKDGRHDDVIYE